ncbi:MAG: hypothetical protein KGL39_41470 [Patescibacteria group bacterium]|nr:hypothetical protein [Patescibacteria group bacterium]
MQYYRCKCGKQTAWGSMPPYPCDGCPDCNTTLTQHPDYHEAPEPHEFSSVQNITTDQGPATITRCRWCGKTREQIERRARGKEE